MTAWEGSAAGFALTVAIWTIGEILLAPSSQSFAADLAPPHMRGAYQGAFALAFTAAFAAAPAIGGAIIARAGAPWLWHGCLVTGAVVAAGFLLLGRRHR
jgi:MFS family permease